MIRKILKQKIDNFINESSIEIVDDSEKFEYFCNSMILKKDDFHEEDLIQGSIDGEGDEGIDAIFISVNGRIISDKDILKNIIDRNSIIKILFIQAKAESGFSETALLKFKSGLESIFEEKYDHLNHDFKRQAEIIKKAWEIKAITGTISKIFIECYYSSLATNDESAKSNTGIIQKKDKVIDYLTEYGFEPKFFFYGCRELIELSNQLPEYRKEIHILNKFKYEEEEGSCGYICLTSGVEYYKFIIDNDTINDNIFDQNVRDFLGKNRRVNNNILNTLKYEDRKYFWCFNNGITIITTKVEQRRNILVLSNYQIINGCQTSYSIYEALKEFDENTLENIKFEIVIKIIEVKEENEELALKIISATNSQNSLESYAMESYRPIHKFIEEMFLTFDSKEPFYYERRPKYYRRRGKPSSRILNPQKLFQICYSVFFKSPSKARTTPTSLFDKYKNDVFKEEFNLEFYRIVYLLYFKILSLIPKLKKEIKDTDIEMKLLKLGQLHITRIVFYLILGKEFNIIPLLSKKHINDVVGRNYYKIIKDNNLLEKYVRRSIKIFIECIKELNFEKSETNIFKLVDLEKKINDKMIKLLITK